MSRRILLYSHDTVGLGHIRRVTAIARSLADRDPRSAILILTGSPQAEAHPLPPNVDIVKLPAVRKVRNDRYEARRLTIPRRDIVQLRASLIRSTLAAFEPDLVIVDKVPLGVHGELTGALKDARERGARVVLSLRDILDEPDEVRRNWEQTDALAAMRTYYDDILVWGTPDVYDVVREYDLPSDVATKIRYCGYIAAESGEPVRRPHGSKQLALATVGGGEDGFDLLRTFIRCLPRTTRRFASVVLMGPDLAEDKRRTLRRLVTSCERPIFAVDFTRHVDRLLDAADVVVTMGGYNTLCEVLSRGRRAIVVPRVNPRREQLLRAERFRDLGLVRMIHPDDLDPDRLARVLEEELAAVGAPPPRLDFNGLERSASLLLRDPAPVREGFAS